MSTELVFICGLSTVFYFSSRLACWFSFPSHKVHVVFLFAFTSLVGKKRLLPACHFRGISLCWLVANSMGFGSEAMQQRHHGAWNTYPELLISWLSRSKRTDGKGSAQLHPLKKPLVNSWSSLHLLVVHWRTCYLPLQSQTHPNSDTSCGQTLNAWVLNRERTILQIQTAVPSDKIFKLELRHDWIF